MQKKYLVGILLIVIIAGNIPFVSYADEYDDTIAVMQQQEAQTQAEISDLEKQTKETQDAISALQGQKAQTQSNVSNLETQSSALQSTINGYSNKLDSLNQEISEAEAAMAEVSSEIVKLNSELQQAKAEEQDRYNLLKKRLKSTYENGSGSGLLQILLESGSIQEFLTKFEYLNAIIEYDQRKIGEYQALQADIENKKAVVEEKEAELDQYQIQLDDRHDELADLTDTVRGQLSSTKNSLSSEKNKLADYDKQLTELDAKMKALEAKTAAAQAALAKQIAERLAMTKEDTSGSYSASADELTWLAATIQAEADGESYTGKLAVGSVIMNRVKSSAFPSTVVGVITQNMQFASYRSGKVELIISNGPNSTCIRAAQEVLDGARVGDYLFFMTRYWADYYGIAEYEMIGNHAFFYRWIVKEKEEEEVQEVEETTESSENNESESSSESENEENSEETEELEENSEDNSEESEEHSEENQEENSDE
ncbi:N-terminal domain of peptidoglycan hydrolase CwlO-containing protein [Butyrivibrio proteoclasticus]|uniref:N-terminal domain of peptidoglycan hydrolase CwlO-containing protein n=1 Tax=Butyrivibrio proteoclasticus TaxID=43305 RepID=A0A1I5RQ30_9FIRM|nr:cell wall hydrolase [Butyrivibrio proteoclasticus]SFP60659.1 N-terminal domain of peptidoglycan hydrolase CwlO-containing protein [Butyrivibrio proteoclasticus]